MNVVGKVGSLITQGVYSVATPFHPFGGAVDIIVVQQQDGSFRSTPWYVQFGKFQGMLKRAEKVVRISVNDVEANFHMYLDNSGEAYFIKEAGSGQEDEKNQVPKDERESILKHSISVDINQCNVDKDNIETLNRLQSTVSDPGITEDDYSPFRPDRLERNDSDACRFYDFQDDQSYECSVELSSEFGSSRYDTMDAVENFQDSDAEMVLVSVDGHILTAPITSTEQNTENLQLGTPQFHLGPGGNNGFSVSENAWDSSEYRNDVDASSSRPDAKSLCGKDDTHSHENQEEDGMRQSDACQDETESDLQEENKGYSSDILEKNEDEGEGRHSIYELRKCDMHKEFVHEDQEVEVKKDVMPECQDLKSDSHKSQDKDTGVSSVSEDASSGTMNQDKFKSCLDLTIAAVDKTSESDDSSQDNQEESKNLAEEFSQNVHISNKTEMNSSGETSDLNVEAVTDMDVEGASVIQNNNDSSSLKVVQPVLSESAEKSNTNSETINSLSTSQGKDCACGDEQVKLKPAVETDLERHASETESNLNQSLPEKMQPSSSTLEISLCRHLLHRGMGLSAANEVFNAHRIYEEEFRSTAMSVTTNENLVVRYKEKYLPWSKAAPLVLGKAVFGFELAIESKFAIPVEEEVTPKLQRSDSAGSSGRKWRLWPIPFRRVKTLQHSDSNSSDDVFVDSESVSPNLSFEQTPASESGTPRSESGCNSLNKKIVRTNIPTNELIASLNLKEGQNDVAFSFSTRVLGLQQVKAHIYLWKWNARIVISDVDGTITKSDVLGQFMPLVGKDWSQSGVARLFSAIKENGYQLLFLSARAIVQAYLTKSFLFNLRQDGKTLPIGPVVISPNGLFPSLFREVIRRAPHEFKIACLEDIKALFPPDYNPFYAGFGNRDTDELTYRRIGIPKGKIFIINPKGEVAINQRVAVKSYTSLHTLADDMFPPTEKLEQEDYNSWNYWKVPLPDIDC